MPTFVAAVRAKYQHQKGSEDAGELVGADHTGKKQALDVLARVFVPNESIDSPGEDGEVSKVCGAIQELDIGGNALDTWTPVQAIAAQLPKLKWLGLDRMPLATLDALPDGFGAAFGGLTTLCVSGTGMAWTQLLFLASAMPKLSELHFSANKLTSLAAEEADASSVLANVTELYLEENAIASWEALAPLATLPKLALLNLNHNLLTSVPKQDSSSSGASAFGALHHLMLRGNPIDSWASIDALDSFPCLTEARLAEMPLTKASSGAVTRRTLIARVGCLKALNGSEVRPRERDDAERFYLRAIAQEYPEGGLPADAVREAATDISDAPPQKDEYGRDIPSAANATGAPAAAAELTVPEGEGWAALQLKHPRWAFLLCKHGTHVTKGAGEAKAGGVIANELVEITFRPIAAEAAHLPAATRKLPGGLPLKSLKLIACQLFKVEPGKMQLLYTPPGQEKDIPEELEDDSKGLTDLGVVSGGTIVIDEVDR